MSYTVSVYYIAHHVAQSKTQVHLFLIYCFLFNISVPRITENDLNNKPFPRVVHVLKSYLGVR